MRRTPEEICLLCQTEKATKTNSHIVPKFMSKGILGNEGPRQGFTISTGEPEKKPEKGQDTSKESYILCLGCEDYLQVLETYIAEHLHKRILNPKFNSDFTYDVNPGNVHYAVCNNLNLLITRLFFMSIYWRCSITSVSPFTNFEIDEAELLREILVTHKTQNLQELLDAPEDQYSNNIPLVVLRSMKGEDQTSNFLYATKSNDGTYVLTLNEYITFFAPEETTATKRFDFLTNRGNNPFVIIAAQDQLWSSFKQMIIDLWRDLTLKTAKEKGVEPWLGKNDPNRR
ncbi:hypothetical protein C9994_13460 [Marivirga lumbricoides]|uniref:Uncharacterized protein n=1 Tax=Marivirga lumbricoides TaxID=1046115 RepID=A0A2T4DGJ9_9BACT|nr:hypothetical protein C9994_13460 [Marivirga lumbricoides]